MFNKLNILTFIIACLIIVYIYFLITVSGLIEITFIVILTFLGFTLLFIVSRQLAKIFLNHE